MLRVLLLAVLVALASTSGCQSIGPLRSDLTVPARETFVLGGDGPAFRATARNTGRVAVTVRERLADGRVAARGGLAPGETAVLEFGRGSAALVVNAADRPARLDVRVDRRGAGELGMGYVPTQP